MVNVLLERSRSLCGRENSSTSLDSALKIERNYDIHPNTKSQELITITLFICVPIMPFHLGHTVVNISWISCILAMFIT